jgi:hypothetical protein
LRWVVAEEDKFAKEVERFETLRGWIEGCNAHITRRLRILETASAARKAGIEETLNIKKKSTAPPPLSTRPGKSR